MFLLHNHRTARALRPGLFPIVVCRHSHRSAVEQVEGTVYVRELPVRLELGVSNK